MSIEYKFNEENLLAELKEYVDSTYDQHYATEKYQATDIIIDSGHGTGFCLGNVIKYAKRYGRKGTSDDARKDLMKVLHYALIQLYIHDKENLQSPDAWNTYHDPKDMNIDILWPDDGEPIILDDEIIYDDDLYVLEQR